MCFFYRMPYSSKVLLMPFRPKQLKVRPKESTETARPGCNTSNFLLRWSLNACALSLPLPHRINVLFHLPVPPPSRSLIHLISASWLVQSPPPFSAGSSSVRPALLAAPYSGAVVSPVESDCASGREVNWKKLRCSHRGAEARGNKLDISPFHVGWRVYTIHPPPHPPASSRLPPCSTHTHMFLHFGQRLTGEMEPQGLLNIIINMCKFKFTCVDTLEALGVTKYRLYF